MNNKRIVENLDKIKFNINNVDHENKTLRTINSTNKLLYNSISNYNTPIKNNENKLGRLNLNLLGSYNFKEEKYNNNNNNINYYYSNRETNINNNPEKNKSKRKSNILSNSNSKIYKKNYFNNNNNPFINYNNINKYRNMSKTTKKLNKSNNKSQINNTLKKLLNKKELNKNNQNNKSILSNQLYDILKNLKEINICNIENKRQILKFKEEYENLFSLTIKKFINFLVNKYLKNNQNQSNVGCNVNLNDIKKKFSSDINKIKIENSSLINENIILKQNEKQYKKNLYLKEIEIFKLKNEIKNLNIYTGKNNDNLKSILNPYYNNEIIYLKKEIEIYQKMINDVFINFQNKEYLQNKVIEQEKKIKEYEQKIFENEKNFQFLNKENNEIKRQLLMAQSKNENSNKEVKNNGKEENDQHLQEIK